MLDILRKYKEHWKYTREHYYAEPSLKFAVDRDGYICCLIPTIEFQPSFARYPDYPVFSITWLNMHICIGKWRRKEKINEKA